MVFGIGGGQSSSDSDSRIWGFQKDMFKRLWPKAFRQMNRQLGGGYQDAMQSLYSNLAPMSMFAPAQFAQLGAGNTAGQQALAENMNAENPWIGQQIDALGADISENLSRNILPELRSGGIAVGQGPGGSATGIASGMAADAAMEEFAQGATQLRFQDVMRQQQAAQSLTQSMLQGTAGIPAAASGAMNLGMTPYTSAWMPYQMMGGLLGNPVVLGESTSDAVEFNLGF